MNKTCVEASPTKQKRQRAKVVRSADVHIKTAYALSVNNVLDAEIELEQAPGAAETMKHSRADELRIYQFIEGLVNGTGFHDLLQCVEYLNVNFLRVKQLHE